MTMLPKEAPPKRLGLVIDLDTCVGCHACAVACKEWNTGGAMGPLSDIDPYGAKARGSWLNRIHGFEVGSGHEGRSVYFPKSCLHCANAECVTVCPTGASYKREEDGIVLVDEDLCIGCGLCAWACPYGARELDEGSGVMKKCTLCVDRIDNTHLSEDERLPACVSVCPVSARHFGDLADPESKVSRLVAERGGFDLMPETGYAPTNKYLPPRPKRDSIGEGAPATLEPVSPEGGFLGWLDRRLGGA
ncbi:MAG: 4Fe-4S dicluster domain-containing protein [Proteobacteria bacterium]|nr:4Fe-4S dicluster domain-containing protein [Pseudomonadota bacterium]